MASAKKGSEGNARGRLSALVLVLLITITVVTPVSRAQEEPAHSTIRVIHGVPDLGPIDLFVDGSVAISGLTFLTGSAGVQLPIGNHRVVIVPSGAGPDQAIAETNVNLSGDGYDLALIGTVADLRFELFPADLRPLDPGRARLRVIHGAPDTGALDTAFIGGDVLFPTVDYAAATDYAELDAGTYDLELRYAGTDTAVVQLPETVLDAGTVTDVVAVGLLTDATFQAIQVNARVGIIQLVGRPAQIRAGGCAAAVGDAAVASLTDLLAARGDSFGQTTAATTENSFTTIPLSFDDLLGVDHAIVVTRSPDEPEVIACGEIGGSLTDVGALVVGLREENGSGFAGVAVLAPNVADPTTTDVSLFLATGLFSAAATAAASTAPESDESAGESTPASG